MKKFALITCLVFLSGALFAQESSVKDANRRTAQRCLSLAESYMLNENYEAAFSQSELGLSYDDSISDLYYIKASSQNKLNKYNTAAVLETIKIGVEKDNWINNNKNNARILYADLLSDTCSVQESLDVLNQAPLIYSADAEFIRIKDFYRLGTKSAIEQARSRIDTARRVYPKDERFPYLFFMFETLFMNDAAKKGLDYVIPANVQKIADDYIMHLPDYKTNKIDMEIMASMFTTGEAQKRLLKAAGEKNSKNPLYALAALKAGVISEEKAFNLYFDNMSEQPLANNYKLSVLEAFVPLITDEALKEEFRKHLDSFNGTLSIDENLDLIDELMVVYERGRPTYISYDVNNDMEAEIIAFCDYGVPYKIDFLTENVFLFYDIYPYVNSVMKGPLTYWFIGSDYVYSPFDMTVNTVFQTVGVDFFIPFVTEESSSPETSIMTLNTSMIQVPVTERENAVATYVMVTGKPYSISYNDENGKVYSWVACQEGFPITRYVDYDNDEILETTEIYKIDETSAFQNDEDKEVIKKIFGANLFEENFYLSQIKIDRNNDSIPEFSEEYLEKGGKISSWDNDGNGIWDYEFIRYPKEENKPLKEETIFYDDKGMEIVSVTDFDGIPSVVKVNKIEQPVVKGEGKNIFWISEKQSGTIEKAILNSVSSKLSIGVVMVVDLKSDGRYSIIKVGKNVFIRRLPPSDADLNIMTREIINE